MENRTGDEIKNADVQIIVAKELARLNDDEKRSKNIAGVIATLAQQIVDLKTECDRKENIIRETQHMTKIAGNIQALAGGRLERYVAAKRLVSIPTMPGESLLNLQVEVMEFLIEKTLGKPFYEILVDMDNKKPKEKAK